MTVRGARPLASRASRMRPIYASAKEMVAR